MQSLNSNNHRALNVLLWGFGHMNKIIIRYLNEKNHKILGVIGNHNMGENAFKIAGLLSSEYQVNITSAQNAQSLIIETQPDICILATKSLLSDIYLSLKILGENNVNVITLAEEPYYSWNTNPILTNELNDLFKLNNIVFTASGAQDMLWGVLPAVLVGSSHKITKIIGSVQFNVDDYGKALCELHGVDLEVKEFENTLAKSEIPSYVWNSNEWLAAKFNWKIIKTTQTISPIVIQNKVIFSKCLNKNILANRVSGLKALVITECENNIVIETSMIGTVYHGDMADYCSWTIEGEPKTKLLVEQPATVELTCATVVNRLEQVLYSKEKGYVPTFKFGLIDSLF